VLSRKRTQSRLIGANGNTDLVEKRPPQTEGSSPLHFHRAHKLIKYPHQFGAFVNDGIDGGGLLIPTFRIENNSRSSRFPNEMKRE